MSSSRDSSESWHNESETTGDDDMDFELAQESTPSGASEYLLEEGEGDETMLYFDAEDGTLRDAAPDEVTFEIPPSNDRDRHDNAENERDDESRTPQAAQSPPQMPTWTITVTQQQILQLLSQAGIRGIFPASEGPRTRLQASRMNARHVALAEEQQEEEEEETEDDDMSDAYYGGYGLRRRARPRKYSGERYAKIPSDEGKVLMDDGTFGSQDRCDHSACGRPFSDHNMYKRRRLARRMLDREMGIQNRGRLRSLNGLATQSLIPSSKADLIVNLNARCYSGQFSEDGSFFFACGQDFKVRMYDTSNPYDWKHYKTVHYYGGQWTITDASLSPDNHLLAYSSIRSQICLARTEQGDSSEPQLLDFSDMGPAGHGSDGRFGNRGHFGIWSLRFSGDGSEIVAGTSDPSVLVYDLEAQRSILRIPGHTEDVNAVCFGDKMSPHILYSGSDDTTLKVWDRRSLASLRPAGMFLGHTEGLTYIDSKGDGRYVISNGKDQTCKLWDLRKMISTDVGERLNPQDYTTNFDYRFSPYDTENHRPHPHDCSIVTFRGHRVLKTLIRCHFSPPMSTNGRYVYSGSHDGKIYVWNVDGTQASEPIHVLKATKNSRPASDERYVDRYDYYGRGGVWKTIVRDCSWHPSAPIIAATSWNGWDHGLGTCTVHSWNDGMESDEVGGDLDGFTPGVTAEIFANKTNLGSTPMGARVTAQLHHDGRFYGGAREDRQSYRRNRDRVRRQLGLGRLWGIDGDDDDDE
ncbi:hypothetical protein M433DRAFT_4183 [Acidomyces richmondensis BFW]|nr:MAG: hypothetical protein FE78DRAFT_27329 [Acidomyces sp. 'richmondensis']KYG45919.1 hypothetical protein M433DRAFT_4183 [Acidomyces richmondensis BFW]